jgi:hypothetical protein
VTIVDRLVHGFQRALQRKKMLEEQNPDWIDKMRILPIIESRVNTYIFKLRPDFTDSDFI